jgi:hypothetical protein
MDAGSPSPYRRKAKPETTTAYKGKPARLSNTVALPGVN